jgi:hypothetical protein
MFITILTASIITAMLSAFTLSLCEGKVEEARNEVDQ